MRRRYTARDNFISALIGCVIAIPICVCAYKSQAEYREPKFHKEETTETVTYINISDALPSAGVSKILFDFSTDYEPATISDQTTEEDLLEEAYYDDLELMAVCVMAEAGNQDLMGKRMVADVILNRVDDPDFPDTISEVITERYAFASYWDGGMERAEPNEDCYTAIRMELETRSYPSILYFTAGEFGKYGTPWKQYGDHYFCTK